MVLFDAYGDILFCGMHHYSYQPADNFDKLNRIQVPIEIEGFSYLTQAYIDTGGATCLSPEIAEHIGLSQDLSLGVDKITFRQITYRGRVYRLKITFINESERENTENLTLDATFFVAESPKEWPKFPCILGMNNALDRCRFAFDPSEDLFFFGPIS